MKMGVSPHNHNMRLIISRDSIKCFNSTSSNAIPFAVPILTATIVKFEHIKRYRYCSKQCTCLILKDETEVCGVSSSKIKV